MSYKSDAQRKWVHTKTGMKALGKKTVEEYDKASKGMKLPEKKKTTKRGK